MPSEVALRRDWARKKAELASKQAEEKVNVYRSILMSSLRDARRLDWESIKNIKPYAEPYPTIESVYKEIGVPAQDKISEFVFPAKKVQRQELEVKAQRLFQQKILTYSIEKQEFQEKQREYNVSIDAWKLDFESGNGESIQRYARVILARTLFPDGSEKKYDVQFDPIGKILIVSFELPQKEFLPRIIGYKYVATKDETKPIEMKPKDFNAFYEECLYQLCLGTIYEIFHSDYPRHLESVVFNGWVSGIDSKTGKEFHACIISCQAPRKEFESYNLERVNSKDCFRNLKGLSAGPLADLGPVRPIIELNREDPRFVPSREVLANLDSSTNLATMDWEEFEHLVRQLFEKVFSTYGGEVKVTQASRDGGVDAIAFDPDPIRGGKFVIQAKRYNNVVPVSATRDLYGTMISEGATKGILVTTSYYGNDSREFVKDKPITLIDGSNLVYMLQQYGYNVAIHLQAKDK